MSLGRSSRFCSLASLRCNLRRCYLPLHLHPPSPFIMVVSCVTGPLTRMLVKPWWIWKCSSSWEHAQALRLIIGTSWDCPRFPRLCYNHSNSEFTLYCWVLPQLPESFPAFAFCSQLAPPMSLPFPVISKFIHCVVFNKVIHIIQVRVCHSTDPLQTIAWELP